MEKGIVMGDSFMNSYRKRFPREDFEEENDYLDEED